MNKFNFVEQSWKIQVVRLRVQNEYGLLHNEWLKKYFIICKIKWFIQHADRNHNKAP